jgi:SAM-dependent methyltransferase
MPGATDYVDGTYLQQNPDWHVPDAAWRVEQILKLLRRNQVTPATVYDIGCGAGEVLRFLQQNLGSSCKLWGSDVSPQAIALCQSRANDRLHFLPWEARPDGGKHFDLVMAISVLAHVEDYRSFLREMKSQGVYKLIHMPLDISLSHVLREGSMIRRRQLHTHLHYFSKCTAMFALTDCGLEIVDWFYTPQDVPYHNGGALKLPRKLLFGMNPDLAVRLLGGYTVWILAK